MKVPIVVVNQFFQSEGFIRETPEGEPFVTFVRGDEKVFHGTIDGQMVETDFVVEDIGHWDSELADRLRSWLDQLVSEEVCDATS